MDLCNNEKKDVMESYTIEQYDADVKSDKILRKAVINFKNNQFMEVKFIVPNTVYDLADWAFLGQVSKRVGELTAIHANKELEEKSE